MANVKDRDLDDRFSEEEASLLVDAFNGTLFSLDPRSELVMGVEESLQLDHLDEKWEVDGDALVAKLRRLSPGTAQAVVDGLQRFWTEGDDRGFAEAMALSGLTTMALAWEDGTGGQPRLWEPHESRNAIDRAVESDSFTPEEAVRWLSHSDERVRDYARGKLPSIRRESGERTD